MIRYYVINRSEHNYSVPFECLTESEQSAIWSFEEWLEANVPLRDHENYELCEQIAIGGSRNR